MAPLDTGSVTHVLRLADPFGRGAGPSLADFDNLGESLRAIRDHKGLSLAQVADATHVRLLYLAAIEQGDLGVLPSRPFAVGYVRAYARTLGLDGDAAVSRFKAEHPDVSEPLRAPVGVVQEHDPRRRVIYAGVGVLVAAVALWNVAQRTLTTEQSGGPTFPAGAQAWPEPSTGGALKLGAPTPPPADQTTPEPYLTPGLGVPGVDPRAVVDPAAPTTVPSPPAFASAAVSAPVFTTRAPIYGVAAKQGGVIIQVKKPASLVIRGSGGAVYFARQLSVGEAYRAPMGRGLTADVSDPTAFDVYVDGRLQGPLQDPQTSLDKLAAEAARPAAAQTANAQMQPTPQVASAVPVNPAPTQPVGTKPQATTP